MKSMLSRQHEFCLRPQIHFKPIGLLCWRAGLKKKKSWQILWQEQISSIFSFSEDMVLFLVHQTTISASSDCQQQWNSCRDALNFVSLTFFHLAHQIQARLPDWFIKNNKHSQDICMEIILLINLFCIAPWITCY